MWSRKNIEYLFIPYSTKVEILAVNPPVPPRAAPSGINTAEAPKVVNIKPNPTILTIPPETRIKVLIYLELEVQKISYPTLLFLADCIKIDVDCVKLLRLFGHQIH